MEQKILYFSGVAFYVNDSFINSSEFKNIMNEGIFTNETENRVHIFNLSYSDEFLKIKFSDGSAKPRNPNVYNQDTKELEPNPREGNQIEPTEYFAVVDLKSSYIWISNSKKKSLLLDFFQDKFGNNKIVLKDVYDEEMFIQTIKTLDQIKISAAPSLFSESNTLSKALTDEMYGAEEATLQLKYNNTLIGDNIFEKLKSLFKSKSSFKNITIAGRDERNLGMLFNNNSFSRKIEIKANIDDNEMFIPENVFIQIISKITEERNDKHK